MFIDQFSYDEDEDAPFFREVQAFRERYFTYNKANSALWMGRVKALVETPCMVPVAQAAHENSHRHNLEAVTAVYEEQDAEEQQRLLRRWDSVRKLQSALEARQAE